MDYEIVGSNTPSLNPSLAGTTSPINAKFRQVENLTSRLNPSLAGTTSPILNQANLWIMR